MILHDVKMNLDTLLRTGIIIRMTHDAIGTSLDVNRMLTDVLRVKFDVIGMTRDVISVILDITDDSRFHQDDT